MGRLRPLVLAALLLSACGFEPLYDPAGPAEAVSGRVEVGVIQGAPGFTMRERLVERLGLPEATQYRLAVDLAFQKQGVAITQKDVTSRFDVTGTAVWTLIPIGSDRAALSGEERATTGYSAPTSDTSSAYAILSAQRDAEERLAVVLADRIARRVALAARETPTGAGISGPTPLDEIPPGEVPSGLTQ
jgi:LPS-assembly lipoprotein